MAKAAFNVKSLLTSKMDLTLRKGLLTSTLRAWLRVVLKFGYFGK
jgi:hypothetical protein